MYNFFFFFTKKIYIYEEMYTGINNKREREREREKGGKKNGRIKEKKEKKRKERVEGELLHRWDIANVSFHDTLSRRERVVRSTQDCLAKIVGPVKRET